MTPLAEAAGATKRFGSLVAVDGASLQVRAGEVVGLLGANGAGKTTLMRMILGLLGVTAGSVRLFGGRPSRATRRRLGYLPQGLGLYGDLTLRENISFVSAAFGARPPDLDADLEGVSDQLVRDLPLGFQRRVAFACALSHDPRLLVLDEPTSGVDPLARARLWETIRAAAEGGAGVLVSTHHMEEAEQCDHLVVMAEGRVAARGSMAEIVGDAAAVEVRAAKWADAFEALERARLACSLVGRRLRVTDADAARTRSVLESEGIEAEVVTVRATFEERFVSLTRAGGR